MKNLGWITCDIHGRQHAYYVCIHIEKVEDVKTRTEWSPILGADLICEREKHGADEIRLLCEAHLRGMGLLPAA